MAQAPIVSLAQRPGVQQFVKFCVIGFSGAFIDLTINYILTYKFQVPVLLAAAVAFIVAVTNGFFWNSRWTFKGMGSGRLHEMYVKFVLVNMVGLALSSVLIAGTLFALGDSAIKSTPPPPLHLGVAKIIAIGCVAVWNFLANRKWTFKTAETGIAPPFELD